MNFFKPTEEELYIAESVVKSILSIEQSPIDTAFFQILNELRDERAGIRRDEDKLTIETKICNVLNARNGWIKHHIIKSLSFHYNWDGVCDIPPGYCQRCGKQTFDEPCDECKPDTEETVHYHRGER